MANFSEDQVRQFYVVTSKATTITNNSAAGAIKVRSSAEDLWFEYASPNGEHGGVGVVRSDLINKKKIDYVTASPARVRNLRRLEVTFDPLINSGAPIVGQDYILRFTFFGLGLGGFENQYIKEGGAYRVKTGNTAANVYEALADLIKVNFSREAYPLIKVSLKGDAATATMTTNSGVTVTAKEVGTAGNKLKFAIASVSATTPGVTVSTSSGVTTITASLTAAAKTIGDLKTLVESATDLVTITGTAATAVSAETTAVALEGGTTTGIIIEEVPQPWVLGKRQADQVHFVLHTVPINVDGSQVPWGVITDTTSTNTGNQVTNGKMVADMEWFYIGERADQFRGVGYPDNFETKYLADPSKTYDFIDIQFYYSGDAEDVQRSKKMITLAIPTDAMVDSDTLTETLIADITSAGVTVNDLTQ